MREWPEPVERVASALRAGAAEARLEEFPDGTPSAKAAAEAAGCELGQIVKSIVFDCAGHSIVALVPGDQRADPTRVARAAGVARARVAGPAQVRAATGFDPGAVAPFPLPQVDRVLIDRRLLVPSTVWIGAGSPTHMAAVAPPELVRLARAEVADLVAEA